MTEAKEKAACELGSTEAALKNIRSNNRQSSAIAQGFAAIPDDLASRPQWLMWRFETKPGDKKPRKVPYYCNGKRRTGAQGSESDRAALVDLPLALAALDGGKFSGVGMALLPGDGLVGIDLDAMIDTDTGEMCERGGAIIAACDSYTEFSPSGKGVHIICSGTTDTFKSNEIGVEVFCGRQYFTFTGHRYPATPGAVNPLPEKVLKRLKATVDSGRKRAADNKPATAPAPAQEGCAKVESALAYVSPGCGHDDWVKAGMAIQAELGEAGFSVWNTWSMKSDKYPGEAELRQRWKSFKPGAGITGATLFKLAMEAGGRRAPSIPKPRRRRDRPTWAILRRHQTAGIGTSRFHSTKSKHPSFRPICCLVCLASMPPHYPRRCKRPRRWPCCSLCRFLDWPCSANSRFHRLAMTTASRYAFGR